MTYVPKWATCERCKTFRPRSEMVRDPRLIRRWACKSCPPEASDSGSEARMALRYEVPPATPELRAAIDRLSDPRENGSSTPTPGGEA